MNRSRSLFATLFSFGILALLGLLAYFLVSWALDAIQTARPDSNLVTVLITVLAGFISLLIKQTLDRRDTIRQELRPKKVSVYEEYMQFWFNLLNITHSSQGTSQPDAEATVVPDEVQQQLVDLARQLILWGSVDLIKKHVALRKLGQPARPFDKARYGQLLLLEDALKAIRSDLGLSNFGLQPGDLLWLFINEDPAEATSQSAADQPPVHMVATTTYLQS
jgi:hypothetical protein